MDGSEPLDGIIPSVTITHKILGPRIFKMYFYISAFENIIFYPMNYIQLKQHIPICQVHSSNTNMKKRNFFDRKFFFFFIKSKHNAWNCRFIDKTETLDSSILHVKKKTFLGIFLENNEKKLSVYFFIFSFATIEPIFLNRKRNNSIRFNKMIWRKIPLRLTL